MTWNKTLFCCVLALLFGCAKGKKDKKHPPHLMPDATSSELRAHLAANPSEIKDEDVIAESLRWGDRTAEYLSEANTTALKQTQGLDKSVNIDDLPVVLVDKATPRGGGLPIDDPMVYSVDIIRSQMERMRKNTPPELMLFLEGAPFPHHLSFEQKVLDRFFDRVDGIYSYAARYKSLLPYLEYFRNNKMRDVRAYHYFKSGNWSLETLDRLAGLTPEELGKVKVHIHHLCRQLAHYDTLETTTLEACDSRFEEMKTASLEEFTAYVRANWADFMAVGEYMWQSYFAIQDRARRSDVDHTDPNVLVLPFKTVPTLRLRSFIGGTVEDEYQWNGWKIKVDFRDDARARLQFKAGETPSVSENGNLVTMDPNGIFESYSAQNTMKHEMGHVLGFPDCYVEFFDDEMNAFVNYQLDTTDLMCSGGGRMNERMYLELTRVYR